MLNHKRSTNLNLVTAIGRRIDGAVCAGAVANAARSVHQDQVRAGQRQDARAAVEQLERMMQSGPRPIRPSRAG